MLVCVGVSQSGGQDSRVFEAGSDRVYLPVAALPHRSTMETDKAH